MHTAIHLNRSHGLAMIEVLVTVVVLAIGLLGLAATQITGLRSTNDASFRTMATQQMQDLVERIRANPAAIDNNAFINVNSASIDCDTLPTPYCSEHHDDTGNVAAATCTPAEMAAFDINTWFCGINSGGTRRGGISTVLPGATLSIACTDTNPPSGADADACTNGSVHTVSLSWSEVNSERGGSAVTQTIAVTLTP